MKNLGTKTQWSKHAKTIALVDFLTSQDQVNMMLCRRLLEPGVDSLFCLLYFIAM